MANLWGLTSQQFLSEIGIHNPNLGLLTESNHADIALRSLYSKICERFGTEGWNRYQQLMAGFSIREQAVIIRSAVERRKRKPSETVEPRITEIQTTSTKPLVYQKKR